MKNKKHSAFTLVELIVVIVILSILATIAFLSFSDNSSDARDSARLADTANIAKGLGVFKAISGNYPLPDGDIIINVGTGFTLNQGIAGEGVLRMIKMSESKDALDSRFYSYTTDDAKTFFSIGGYLENPAMSIKDISNPFRSISRLDEAKAADYSDRYFFHKGDGVGILTESGTDLPIEQLYPANTIIDLVSETRSLNFHLSSSSIISGTGFIIGTIQSAQHGNYDYRPPSDCPTGFIPIPGNREFFQPGFCVMKYEAKAKDWNPGYYSGGINVISGADHCFSGSGCGNNNGIADQDDFPVSWGIKSSPEGLPIGYISQEGAIQACKNLGAGYHLITNNEWMTIARNAESMDLNWSSGLVGSGFIYSGHNDSMPNSVIEASSDDLQGYYGKTSALLTQKRTFSLSNGQIIWDISGNIWEHVNKANTIDGTLFNNGQTKIKGTSAGAAWDDDGKYDFEDMNKYGPYDHQYDMTQGIGGPFYGNGVADNVMLRGGRWMSGGDLAGLYTIRLDWRLANSDSSGGFRCAR